jgi:hypothetical protein
MAKGSGGTRMVGASRQSRDEKYYHEQSVRLKVEALQIADTYKGNPLRFRNTNGILADVEVTKSDIKTIVSKATPDEKFNAIKNAIAKDIPGYLKKAKYMGWRKTDEGKHQESAYFAYYNRTLGAKTYLCVRMINGRLKPYAIITEDMYQQKANLVQKGYPINRRLAVTNGASILKDIPSQR